MKRTFMTFLLGSLLILSACGADNAQEETPDGEAPSKSTTEVSEGESLYKMSCSGCHGGNLKGNMGPSLIKVGNKYTEQELLDIIENGLGAGMPKGLYKGEEAEAVAAWLATKK